jgi:hypothetical protein
MMSLSQAVEQARAGRQDDPPDRPVRKRRKRRVKKRKVHG